MPNLDIATLKPGDVVIVEMGSWYLRAMIWIQAVFTGRAKYRRDGHVIVVSHKDDAGRLWGIEARPGGIGWADLTYRSGQYGLSNAEQPKSDDDRYVIVETMKSLLGSKYDYLAYVTLALQMVGVNENWQDYKGDKVPAHFICSAVADYVYEERKLANPGSYKITRFTTPAEWASFVDHKEWENA